MDLTNNTYVVSKLHEPFDIFLGFYILGVGVVLGVFFYVACVTMGIVLVSRIRVQSSHKLFEYVGCSCF
jgi:hypothetical protein